jgi:hypothetical protein
MAMPPRWMRTSALRISPTSLIGRPSGEATPVQLFNAAAADAAELVIVDLCPVGDEQDDGCVVDVELDGDLARFDVGQEQVEHDAAAARADVEAAGARPGAKLALGAVVSADPLAVGGDGRHCVCLLCFGGDRVG